MLQASPGKLTLTNVGDIKGQNVPIPIHFGNRRQRYNLDLDRNLVKFSGLGLKKNRFTWAEKEKWVAELGSSGTKGLNGKEIVRKSSPARGEHSRLTKVGLSDEIFESCEEKNETKKEFCDYPGL